MNDNSRRGVGDSTQHSGDQRDLIRDVVDDHGLVPGVIAITAGAEPVEHRKAKRGNKFASLPTPTLIGSSGARRDVALTRMSMRQLAFPAMTLRAVPPLTVPTLIVVPRSWSASPVSWLMISASEW